ncbi:Gst Glutathione S-transferase [Rhabdaerophilaceae bacterium]
MRIFGDMNSGNCLKVVYAADFLGIGYTFVPVDITKGEARTPDFLAKNDMAQVPAVELDDGRHLAQSNAILRYLARGSALLPDDGYLQAKIDELLFWEQYSHEPYVAVCRFQMVYLGKAATDLDPEKVKRGNAALDFMDNRLATREFFVGEAFSIADIALLPYTRLAHEGGFDLSTRPALTGWILRCDARLGLSPALKDQD